MKYLGAGTVSFLGFLLATACGQGGSAGIDPPTLGDDSVPDSYDDIPPSSEVVPGDPDRPIGPTTDGVPNNQGDPPPGGGVSCRQYCTAIIATGCATSEDESELTVGDCTTICNDQILPEPCSRQLLETSMCIVQLLPPGSCDFEEVAEDDILAACYSPLMAYVQCAGVDDGTDPPDEGTVSCTCACACEYGCSGSRTSTCSASGAQACALCDDSCDSFCVDQDCGLSIVPAATPASCVGE